jgi:pyrimidine-nucleoside phosphorylase
LTTHAYNPVELIRKKRDGLELTDGEIQFFFSSYLAGGVADYQASAMLMAIYFRSMTEKEMFSLVNALLHSGKVLDLSALPFPKVDKHSTGGVGDKTSLIIAPIAASLGVAVPMISGRGLGHTGGTLDKLESIPNFNINLSIAEFKAELKKIQCSLIGQTAELAPLDKLLYALRDVTATVESIPLIAASIMSKKIASGLDGLVLDVKTGSGAFMQKFDDSKRLAETLVKVGESFGKKVLAFITDMNDPLGQAVGNWLEVKECVECLQGSTPSGDLMEVSLALSGAMLLAAGKAKSLDEGITLSKKQIENGQALQKWFDIVKFQEGDATPLKDFSKYPRPKHSDVITSTKTGFVSKLDALQIGIAAVELGAGRFRKEDKIDPKAGFLFKKKLGDPVRKGDVICEIFTDKPHAIDAVKTRLATAIQVAMRVPETKSKIITKLF